MQEEERKARIYPRSGAEKTRIPRHNCEPREGDESMKWTCFPILISKNRLQLLKKICEITGDDLRSYVEHALLEKVQTDLENPNCFGQSVCETLLKQWDKTN